MVTLKRIARAELTPVDPKKYARTFPRLTIPTHKLETVPYDVVVSERLERLAGDYEVNIVDDSPSRLRYALYGSQEYEPLLHAYWLVGTEIYRTDDHDLTSEDVRALINVQSNRRRLQLEKAHALQAMVEQLEPKVRRERIPQDVKVFIWQRDKGRCVECDGNSNLEFDHVIPLALGGSNTARNLQLLCETCNRRKGASLG